MAGKTVKVGPMSKPTPKGVNMSKPVVKPTPAWKPQKGIPNQMKVKTPGAGWGGEKPIKKK